MAVCLFDGKVGGLFFNVFCFLFFYGGGCLLVCSKIFFFFDVVVVVRLFWGKVEGFSKCFLMWLLFDGKVEGLFFIFCWCFFMVWLFACLRGKFFFPQSFFFFLIVVVVVCLFF